MRGRSGAAACLAAAAGAVFVLAACESSGGITVTGTGRTNQPVVGAYPTPTPEWSTPRPTPVPTLAPPGILPTPTPASG